MTSTSCFAPFPPTPLPSRTGAGSMVPCSCCVLLLFLVVLIGVRPAALSHAVTKLGLQVCLPPPFGVDPATATTLTLGAKPLLAVAEGRFLCVPQLLVGRGKTVRVARS